MDALEGLRPVSDDYASLPVEAAFTWPAVVDEMPPGEWYMVAFRSVRKPGADEAMLDAYDSWAHQEAEAAPGFGHYFRGPIAFDGSCMSFCFWASRAEARAAAGKPSHARAAAITHETYSWYSLEFHRVRRLEGVPQLEFELYDAAEPVRVVIHADEGSRPDPSSDHRRSVDVGPATA